MHWERSIRTEHATDHNHKGKDVLGVVSGRSDNIRIGCVASWLGLRLEGVINTGLDFVAGIFERQVRAVSDHFHDLLSRKRFFFYEVEHNRLDKCFVVFMRKDLYRLKTPTRLRWFEGRHSHRCTASLVALGVEVVKPRVYLLAGVEN